MHYIIPVIIIIITTINITYYQINIRPLNQDKARPGRRVKNRVIISNNTYLVI